MSIELHGAFVWDCDNCGAENFERAIEGNLDEEHMDDIINAHEPVIRLVAPGEETEEHDDGANAAVLVTQVLLAPKIVRCSSCLESFPTEVVTDETHD